jgi:hypothetical protein
LAAEIPDCVKKEGSSFSEEKEKDFYLCAGGKIPAQSLSVGVSIVEAAKEQKSFASFLQKRRTFCH